MSSSALFDDETNLVDRLLAEQRTLTAVERFALRHERGAIPTRSYEDLIPLTKPAPGQQYAFAVDLDACTGCKACVSACHSLNGLDENETWRDVGLLIGERTGAPYLQTVTTACHHCLEPGCLEGCPVLAYEKDADTGVVRHLDDQCIGCQYCTLKCPYGVPKYSERLGIVRKCDMCHERLAVGEAPACVQACPHQAITIRLVDVAEVSAAAAPGSRMIPGAFDSSYTKPTTTYHSRKPAPAEAQPADAHHLSLEHAHWPLIFMLVLTQLAAGLFVAAALASNFAFPLSVAGFVALNAGLFAAVFHLGRPLGAWRFFLGLRTSWMSREILAFSVLAGVAAPTVGLAFLLPGHPLTLAALATTAALGLIAVFTSAMIYVTTRRALWSPRHSFGRFFGATFLLGATSSAIVLGPVAVWVATILRAVLFAGESVSFLRTLRDLTAATHLSTRTLRERLAWLPATRLVLFATSTALSGGAILTAGWPWAAGAFLTTLASQVLERYAFFTTVRAPKMPGGF